MKNKLLSLKNLFWFVDFKKIDLEKDKNLIIHQTLALGDWVQVKYLFKIYSKSEIRQEFLKLKKGIYQPKILNLSKLLLGVKKLPHEEEYIKNIYGKNKFANSR